MSALCQKQSCLDFHRVQRSTVVANRWKFRLAAMMAWLLCSVSSIECCRTLASETRRWYEASELSFDQVSKGDRCAVLKDGSNNLNAYR